ncbi:MAG: hypothetical protein JWR10_1614 [Rubritepida sp.]|nr:hypothetical protein [Rubritepida sp.]
MDEDLNEIREPGHVRVGAVLGVGLGTILFLAATLGLLPVYIRWMAVPPNAPPQPERFPPPRLEADPTAELRALRAEQAAQLEGYAWVDRERGLLRIPVARAMEILAARGQAAYAPLEAPSP